jgi:hypothetical protein
MKIAIVALLGICGCMNAQSLPWCDKSTMGVIVEVNDLAHPRYGETAVRGGHTSGRVYCEGTHWVVMDVGPLKCGKYEHVEAPPFGDCGFNGSCFTPYCAPDMHLVTEKEWQEMITRIETLEKTHLIVEGNCWGCQSNGKDITLPKQKP